MLFIQRSISNLMAIVSLLTATGLFFHEGHVDKAAVTAVKSTFDATHQAAPDIFIASLQREGHAHGDHGGSRNLISGFSYANPGIHPRENHHKKFMLQRIEPRGRHAFDNSNLPIVD